MNTKWLVRLAWVQTVLPMVALVVVLIACAWVVFHPAHKTIVCLQVPGRAMACASK